MNESITLQPGDYVHIADLENEAQYRAVGNRMMQIADDTASFPRAFWRTDEYLELWAHGGGVTLVHTHSVNGRRLTPAQILGIQEPEWNGEGLPPVGTKVSKRGWNNKHEGEVLIVAHHDDFAIGCFGPDVDDYQAFTADELQPLRSEEDQAIEQMLADVGETSGKAECVRKSVCRRLYRAGWRKVESA